MKKCLFHYAACMGFIALTSCNNGPDGTTVKSDSTATTSVSTTVASAADRNKKTIMTSMEAMNRHDVDGMLKESAPAMIEYGDGRMDPIKSVDSLKTMIRGWFVAFPDFKCENTVYVADGNTVMVESDCSGTWKGDFMGMKATNKSFKVKDVDIFTLDDQGKVVSHRSIQNMGPVYESIGMKMPGAMKPAYDINPTPHSEKKKN